MSAWNKQGNTWQNGTTQISFNLTDNSTQLVIKTKAAEHHFTSPETKEKWLVNGKEQKILPGAIQILHQAEIKNAFEDEIEEEHEKDRHELLLLRDIILEKYRHK